MEVKDYRDYIEELEGYFPEFKTGEVKKILVPTISKLITYSKRGRRAYKITARGSIFSKKRGAFVVGNVYGKVHLRGLKKIKELKANKKRIIDGKTTEQ